MIKASALGLATTLAELVVKATQVKQAAGAALDQEAARLVTEMQARVAVDQGGLRASIRQRPARDGAGVVIIAGGTPETMKPSAGGFTFDEALGVEFGTSKMAAEPFFFPVIAAHRDALEGRVKAATDDATKGA